MNQPFMASNFSIWYQTLFRKFRRSRMGYVIRLAKLCSPSNKTLPNTLLQGKGPIKTLLNGAEDPPPNLCLTRCEASIWGLIPSRTGGMVGGAFTCDGRDVSTSRYAAGRVDSD